MYSKPTLYLLYSNLYPPINTFNPPFIDSQEVLSDSKKQTNLKNIILKLF